MIVAEICIICLPAGRKYPLNLILLGLFTLGEAYLVSFICTMTAYETSGYIVLIAFVMTLGRYFVI
jgi:FtsH-binding integral membrane protein